MKAKALNITTPRVRRISMTAACLAFFLFISEPAYASSNLTFSVTIPSVASNLESTTPLPGQEGFDPTPSLLELDAVKTVDASAMALISVAARQVDLARQPDGARELKRVIGTTKQEIESPVLMELRKHFLPPRWRLWELIGEQIQ
jgi:hypothetical protein